jgi:hypothetical protein
MASHLSDRPNQALKSYNIPLLIVSLMTALFYPEYNKILYCINLVYVYI